MTNSVHNLKDLTLDWWENAMIISGRSPVVTCAQCAGLLKPDVVFFGEPVRELENAENWIAQCDLLLVLGSSLTVYPVAVLPRLTRSQVIVVNQGEVALSPAQNRYFVNDSLDLFFKKVVDFIDSRP